MIIEFFFQKQKKNLVTFIDDYDIRLIEKKIVRCQTMFVENLCHQNNKNEYIKILL